MRSRQNVWGLNVWRFNNNAGSFVRRANTFVLAPTVEQERILRDKATNCAKLWNEATYHKRQAYMNYQPIDWKCKDLYQKYSPLIDSATAQQIIRKSNESWRSFFALKQLALMALPAKTGIRIREELNIDLDDIDLENGEIKLKPNRKRDYSYIFLDDECKRVLRRWIDIRPKLAEPGENALFLNDRGVRMGKRSANLIIESYAEKAGLHDSEAEDDLSRKFTHHCFRHFFTIYMSDRNVPRDYVLELRGDRRKKQALDVYRHILKKKLRRVYLENSPQFGL